MPTSPCEQVSSCRVGLFPGPLCPSCRTSRPSSTADPRNASCSSGDMASTPVSKRNIERRGHKFHSPLATHFVGDTQSSSYLSTFRVCQNTSESRHEHRSSARVPAIPPTLLHISCAYHWGKSNRVLLEAAPECMLTC